MHEYAPRQIHASTVGTKYGPGPFLARIKGKKAEPKNIKTAMMTEGYIKHRERVRNRCLMMKSDYTAPQLQYTVRLQPQGM